MLYRLCGVRKYNFLNCGHHSKEVIKVLNQLGQRHQNLSGISVISVISASLGYPFHNMAAHT